MKNTIERFMGAMESELGFFIAVVVFVTVLFAIAIISERKMEIKELEKIKEIKKYNWTKYGETQKIRKNFKIMLKKVDVILKT